MTKTFVIVNPAAGHGKLARRWEALLPQLEKVFPHFDWQWTDQPGSAQALTRRALSDNFDLIIAAGGDGTLSECVNGFLKEDQPVNPKASMGLLPLGSGSDFARSLDIPRNFDEALAVLAQKKSRSIDVGKCVCHNVYGKKFTRYFINIANVGLVSEVVNFAHHAPPLLGPTGSYIYGALKGMNRYQSRPVRYSWRKDDGIKKDECVLLNMIIANGMYFGSGMKAAPKAKLDDGTFDVLVGPRVKLWRFLKALPGFYRGTHAQNPHVKTFKTSFLEISTTEAVNKLPVEMDGDSQGFLPARFEILPARLNFIC